MDGLTIVSDQSQEVALKRLASEVVSSSTELDTTFLASHRWSAVPVFSGYYFTPADYEAIASVIRNLGYQFVYAIPTEPYEQFPNCLRIHSDGKSLQDFDNEFGAYSFVLAPQDFRFLILLTYADFHIVAGPSDVVSALVGKPIRQALEEFQREALEFSHFTPGPMTSTFANEETSRYLEVLERYKDLHDL